MIRSRELAFLAMVWSVAAGCASSRETPSTGAATPAVDLPRTRVAGTRLTPVRLVTEEGVEAFGSWRDRKLGTTCAFSWTDDGRWRCVPPGPQTALFEDNRCEQPVFPTGRGCDGSTYGRWYTGERTAAVARLGPARPIKQVFMRVEGDDGAPGRCIPAPALAGRSFRPTLERVNPSAFVAQTGARPERTDRRLVAYVRTMEDGALERLSLFDNQLQASCVRRLAEDGVYRCLPPVNLTDTWSAFADASCQRRLEGIESVDISNGTMFLAKPFKVAPPPRAPGGARVAWTVRRLTARRHEGRTYVMTEQGCAPQDPPDHITWFDIREGEAVPPQTFATFDHKMVRKGRLRRTWHVTADGTVDEEPTHGFEDQRFGGAECGFARSTDGRWRCLPGTGGYSYAYEDAACTRRLIPRTMPRFNLSAGLPATWGTARVDVQCEARYGIFERGPEPTQTFTRGLDGTCTPVPIGGPRRASGSTRGREISPDEFVVAEEQTD